MAEHDEAFDAKLQEMVRDSYGQVTLSEDSFARMLANLEQAADEQAAVEHVPVAPVARRRPRVLRFALPVAACLLAALVAGVVAFNAPMGNDSMSAPTEGVIEESAAESEDRDASMSYENAEGEMDYVMAEGNAAAESNASEQEADVGKAASSDDAMTDGNEANVDASASSSVGEASEMQPEASFAARFPQVEMASGQTLQLVKDKDGNPQKADTSKTLQYLEDAKAYAPGSQDPAPCAIYVTDDGSYAASFDGDPSFYLLESA